MADQITLAEQINAVESVVKTRRAHHPSAQVLMSLLIGPARLEEVKNRIERENAAMEAALVTLKRLQWEAEACPDQCDHTIAEHVAFDDGVMAGERGDDDDTCPHGASDLREAWLAGHSVGSINRENSNESTGNNRD
jgi:ribosome modulation factor